jgi:hypothetical protein
VAEGLGIMTAPEHEVIIEITCTDPPPVQWPGGGLLHLGIQKHREVLNAAPVSRKRLVFRPLLRVRRHTDGSANFLGPFAQGPRSERFIYLNWMVVHDRAVVAIPGRIKLHLSQISWSSVESAARAGTPIKVTFRLRNAAGKPVFASVRAGAHWEL